MKNSNHPQLHHDHIKWNSDIEMWNYDLKLWDDELISLNDALGYIQDAVKKHEESLEEHYKSINKHKKVLASHELKVSHDDSLSEISTGIHIAEAEKHETYKQAHERLKKYQHSIMVLTKNLKKAIESVPV